VGWDEDELDVRAEVAEVRGSVAGRGPLRSYHGFGVEDPVCGFHDGVEDLGVPGRSWGGVDVESGGRGGGREKDEGDAQKKSGQG
jgi:hypothetical protein